MRSEQQIRDELLRLRHECPLREADRDFSEDVLTWVLGHHDLPPWIIGEDFEEAP